jgi:DNA replicative helicase MCM subunit Mcm2 (Cdc46/Mcm family)
VYPALSEGKPGLVGALTARAEAQVLRLSCVYALLNCSPVVDVAHLRAALELWRYCEESTCMIFESGTGNKQADRILQALKVASQTGLTKTEISYNLFNRNVTRFELDEALRLIHRLKLGYRTEEKTTGRAVERWFYGGTNEN